MKQATRQKYRKSMQYIKQLDEKIKTESEMLNILKKELINITIDEVCETYNVKFELLLRKDRHTEYVIPRQVIMYKLRKLGLSLMDIGKALHRDHTTILHGIRTIENQKDLYDDIKID